MNKLETQAARERLRLRQLPDSTWQVFASVHGTQVFRWWYISEAQKNWYQQHFPEIKIVPFDKQEN